MDRNGHAVIVGGAGGIGSAIARRLASEGYQVTIADVNLDRAKSLISSLEGKGHDAVKIDATDDASVDATLDAIDARAPARVIVVATGGMVIPPHQTANMAANILNLSTVDWNKGIVLNLNSVFFCLRKFAQLRAAKPVKQARIIVLGSGAGKLPAAGLEACYAVPKAAVANLVRQAAIDFAPMGITANTIAPGPIATEAMMERSTEELRNILAAPSLVKRLGKPEEVAAGVVFLAALDAEYVTGTTLDINGGTLMN